MLQDSQNMKFFDFHAILIQKVYLGYMSRKYIHSYFHRKKCLANIEMKDSEIKDMMASYVQEQETMLRVALALNRKKNSTTKKHSSKNSPATSTT